MLIIRAKLGQTKWGYAIDFEGQLAFLEYNGNVRDFEIGKEYDCIIAYHIMFAKDPDKSCKDWVIVRGNTLEDIINHSYFVQYNLDIKKAKPHFSIKIEP